MDASSLDARRLNASKLDARSAAEALLLLLRLLPRCGMQVDGTTRDESTHDHNGCKLMLPHWTLLPQVCRISGCDYTPRDWVQLHSARVNATTARRDWMQVSSIRLDARRLGARYWMPLDASRLHTWRLDAMTRDPNKPNAGRLDAS